MKKHILSLILLGFITGFIGIRAENTSRQVDSLKLLLKTAPNSFLRVQYLTELSAYLVDMDSYSEAMVVAKQAEVLSEQIGYRSGAASAFRKMAVCFTQEGNYPLALQFLFKSLKINDSLKDARELFMLENNLGTVYCLQKEYNMALTHFFKSREYKNASITIQNRAWATANIGWTFLEQGKYRTAIEYYQKSMDLYVEANDKNGIAGMINNIGTSYEYLGENDKALKNYLQSLKIKEEIGDNQGIIDALAGIGDVLMKQGRKIEAIKFEQRSLILAQKIGYLQSIPETELALSKLHESIGNKSKALNYYKNYVTSKEELYSSEKTKQSVREEMNFNFQKQQEIEKLQQDKKDAVQIEKLKQQQMLRNAFILGFSMILIFSIFLFRSFRKTSRQKEIIEDQKGILEHKSNELNQNINYAAKIQQAILPSQEYMKNNLPDHFLIAKPRDIVNGDFYWMYRDNEDIYFAMADCTSHGSSAALLTMIGSALLNEIVIERKITQPDLVLNELRDRVIRALNKSGATEERKEGMDIVFCKLSGMELQSACANNSIYIIREKELIQVKANRYPIGKYLVDSPPFTLNTIELKPNDLIWTFSDGFQDQFGGPNNKKLMSKQFKQWATELSELPMPEIKQELENRFNAWIGNSEQTDDVSILTLRV